MLNYHEKIRYTMVDGGLPHTGRLATCIVDCNKAKAISKIATSDVLLLMKLGWHTLDDVPNQTMATHRLYIHNTGQNTGTGA